MGKNPLLYVKHILEYIGYIEVDIKGHDFESFNKSRQVKQLVERNLQIISEASSRISDALKEEEKEIPWKKIVGLGNILRHDYGKIDYKILWDICKNDLPPLKEAALRMQQKLEGK